MSEETSEIVWDEVPPIMRTKSSSSRASPPPGGTYKILIDGDIVAYRSATAAEKRVYTHPEVDCSFNYKKDIIAHCRTNDFNIDEIAFTYETEDVTHALHNVKTTINTIIENLVELGYSPQDITIYLSGATNFRDTIYPEYKGNREEMRRPTHLDACKQYMVDHHQPVITSVDCEADDLMAIKAHEDLENSIIVSLDKDLKMVPCLHYNWVKGEDKVVKMEKMEGLLTFYRQLLTGDVTDNIPGIKGVGPKTAKKILPSPLSEWEMYHTVLMEYISRGGVSSEDEGYPAYITEKIQEVSRNARLLWMQTKVGEVWQPPAPVSVTSEPSIELRMDTTEVLVKFPSPREVLELLQHSYKKKFVIPKMVGDFEVSIDQDYSTYQCHVRIYDHVTSQYCDYTFAMEMIENG